MEIDYRPARSEDLDAGAQIVQQAINDLRGRHGLAPNVPFRPPAFPAFCLTEEAGGLWVAETDGTIVGFGFSWVRERFWYLAQLFISPATQARGVGQALLHRTLEQAHRHGADNRALITLAYNRASTGLYLRHGMYPREPLYRVSAPVGMVVRNIGPPEHDLVPIDVSSEPPAWLGNLDEQVLGFSRSAHHGFLLRSGAGRAVRIERAGQRAGYAYLSSDGQIGPLAVVPGADAGGVVEAAIAGVLEGHAEQVSMIVPGRAERIFATVTALGFQIDEPLVLMSARSFGDWRHYLPASPTYL